MNVLFLLIGSFDNVNQHEIYPDLVRKFRDEGNHVYVVCSNERRLKKPTQRIDHNGVSILRVKIGNITKSNIIEKGISTILIEHQYNSAIQKYFANVKFDLIVYATPPITLERVIFHIKKRDHCCTYLMLKDIFPQNAIDLSLLKTSGLKGIMYRYFRHKEKKLYKVSDYIGCMSKANCGYILAHNPEVNPDKVEICPNCFDVSETQVTLSEKELIRRKYEIPHDKLIFVYGGNLGKPQGIPFLLECLESQKDNKDVFFMIVGDGTEYFFLASTLEQRQYQNVRLLRRIPTQDYEKLISACDIGLVFLDHRFTIPNYPSRILSYMQAKMPVIACTDICTDIRNLIEDNRIGWWCESKDSKAFAEIISKVEKTDLKEMGARAFSVLKEQYNIDVAYRAITRHL